MYKEYTGGTGPSEEQVYQNNQALLEELLKHGIQAKHDDLNNIVSDLSDEPIQILTFDKDGTVHTVGYDRWGFCSETMDLDQAGWDETLKAILN